MQCGGPFSHRDSEGLCKEAGKGSAQTINIHQIPNNFVHVVFIKQLPRGALTFMKDTNWDCELIVCLFWTVNMNVIQRNLPNKTVICIFIHNIVMLETNKL